MQTRLNRDDSLQRLRERTQPWDLIVIGGGATGVGTAMDAANRGLQVLLLERFDFGKGTSSRSTKLVHGGVRYLKQGNITLVRDALRERTLLKNNAPHLVHDTSFLIPCENLWQWLFYGIGLKCYDLLAAGNNFGRSRLISSATIRSLAPAMQCEGLRGAVLYHDGQFDDTRLLINMAQTAHQQGACLLNYMAVTGLSKNDAGDVDGVSAIDDESGQVFQIRGKSVVNAAGPFCDDVRKFDDVNCEPMVAASQGIHLVFPKEFFPGQTAMIVPKTSDGRVIFIIPWRDHAVVGTTDTAIPHASFEPSAQEDEIQFLLDTAGDYLTRPPKRSDVLSVFTGIRPLVKGDRSARTASLSRDHVIRISDSKLITITGGKWTTVRKMAEDCVDNVIQTAGLTAKPCGTKGLRIYGWSEPPEQPTPRSYYGSDQSEIAQLEQQSSQLAAPIHEQLDVHGSDVVWAVRNEMARTVEDVLARRTRSLFLNARASLEAAPKVAALMAAELGTDSQWCDDQLAALAETAAHYLPPQT
ncbi:glycerol-3-phosphate dehydrogenase/oxidase [Stieleria sp. TO1_6]|uniref:glycerol-3-phosphate dehydrogenase/oxidase n=1 Tax=Stieleria tagensis TaxID=2956795 RepID=UPI00209B4AEE|nr:glycerol-3-phosphate dehydrogenase/oxidase [Stieleria tagensis]MCO8124625.1 glycerol-3-phosphate dehydrogenase/oxidase [Stieleria tagensis]